MTTTLPMTMPVYCLWLGHSCDDCLTEIYTPKVLQILRCCAALRAAENYHTITYITDKYTMNKQLYDIPSVDDLAEIRAWAAVHDNRSAVITVGTEPDVRYQLVVYDQPYDEPSIPRAEAALGAMIVACAWPE